MSAASAPELLRVRDLTVSFATRRGPVAAVRGIDLSLQPGQCLAVVGESGSGKSVTARALLGLAGASATVLAAELSFEGAPLLGNNERQWRRLRGARIGFVLQDALSSLDPLRRVRDEVAEPLAVHGLARGRDRADRVLSLLRDAGIPDPHLRVRQYPHELSGGLRQRVLIASAIAASPSLVIADEPTTALDVTVQKQVVDLLAAKRDAGTAILLISHDLSVVARIADQIAVMYDGLIVEQGSAELVLNEPVHPYTRDLLAAVPSLTSRPRAARPARRAGSSPARPDGTSPGCPYQGRCDRADDQCRTALPPLTPPLAPPPGSQTALADGRTRARCWHRAPPPDEAGDPLIAGPSSRAAGATILEVDGIAKRFRSSDGSWRQAVSGVSFELRAGEALGVVGESGSGKSTVAQIVVGLLAPDAGEVRLDGAAWSTLRERDRRPSRSRIQLLHQDPLGSFDPRFTAERIVAEALGPPVQGDGGSGGGRSRGGRRGAAARRSRITELLGMVGLEDSILGRRGRELSGGQRQRLAIARALAPEPEVIVCDEPVSALDVSVQAQILDLFKALRSDLGVALLFISHDLGVIHEVCDRVLVMRDGLVVEQGAVTDVLHTPSHPFTQSLLAALPSSSAPAPSPNRPS